MNFPRSNNDRNNQADNQQKQGILLYSGGRWPGSIRTQERVSGPYDNARGTKGIVSGQAGSQAGNTPSSDGRSSSLTRWSGRSIPLDGAAERSGLPVGHLPPFCRATKQELTKTHTCDLFKGHEGEHVDLLHLHGWTGPKRTNLPWPKVMIVAGIALTVAALALYVVEFFGDAR